MAKPRIYGQAARRPAAPPNRGKDRFWQGRNMPPKPTKPAEKKTPETAAKLKSATVANQMLERCQ